MNHWQILGNINPKSLTENRLQLHYAIQLAASVSNCLIEPKSDFSHISFSWNQELNSWVSGTVNTAKPFKVALNPSDFNLLILESSSVKLAQFSLEQKTLAEGIDWLKIELSTLGANIEQLSLIDCSHLPDHPLAHGNVFDTYPQETRQEFAAYYADTYLILQDVIATQTGASPIRTWPHHFDIASLISLPYTSQGEAVSIGVGMSPGDSSYDEPYWYITPWPYPDAKNLPDLAVDGTWHTKDWVGAILSASQLATEDHQQSQVKAFFEVGVEVFLQLLEKNRDR